jgi:hypothetical protein
MPTGLRDFSFAFATILVAVLLGVFNTVLANSSWTAVFAIVYANIALGLQIFNFRQPWEAVMSMHSQVAGAKSLSLTP